jgi:1,2-phenylacetyl-CoA epoxidase catalytic subunit
VSASADLAKLLRTVVAAKHDLGFRWSSWLVSAPGIEGRIALAGMALEEEGHARVLEGFLTTDLNDPPVDRDALVRWDTWPGADRRARIEHSWPEALAQCFVLDATITALLRVLALAIRPRLAQRAAQMVREERFHHVFAVESLKSLAPNTRVLDQLIQAARTDARARIDLVSLQDLASAGELPPEAPRLYDGYLDEINRLQAAMATEAQPA